MNPALPLLLKLAAAVATSAAAILSFRSHHRAAVLRAVRRSIHHALLHLPAPAPPTILIIGFRGHGKSAFVNTACRALAGEVGPMILRAETGPLGRPPTTAERRAVRVEAEVGDCGCAEEMLEDGVVELVDGPPLPEPAVVTRADVEEALDSDSDDRVGRMSECVVVLVSCSRKARRRLAVRRLTEISSVIRDRGLHLVVVLTHKRCLRSSKQAEELKKEVALRARTDCVYFIENYTANCSTKSRTPTSFKSDFDTDFTALTIIRQCVTFAEQRRRQSPRRTTDSAPPVREQSEGSKEAGFNKS